MGRSGRAGADGAARLVIARATLALVLAAVLAGCGEDQIGPPDDPGAVVWTRLTDPSLVTLRDISVPDWRGRVIVFTYHAPPDSYRLATIEEDGTNLTLSRNAPKTLDVQPRWVSDSLVIYSRDYDLWYWSPQTGARRSLISSAAFELFPAPRPGQPAVAYTDVQSGTQRIALIPDTTAVPASPVHLTPSSTIAIDPDWSPQGDRLAYSASDSVGGPEHLWLLALNGSAVTSVTPLTVGDVHDRGPRFSPDGTKILFRSNRSGRSGLWWISPDAPGSDPQPVAFEDTGKTIAAHGWSPDGTRIIALTNGRGGPADWSFWILSNLP